MSNPQVKRELLDRVLDHDSLPDDLTFEKINDRAENFTKNGSKFSFSITRHPGYNREMSGGSWIGLSAWWEENTRYTYDVAAEKWEAEVVDSVLMYDTWRMAYKEVDSLIDGGVLPHNGKVQDIESLLKEALEITENYYYETRDVNVSDDVFKRMIDELLAEMRKQIVERYSK